MDKNTSTEDASVIKKQSNINGSFRHLHVLLVFMLVLVSFVYVE